MRSQVTEFAGEESRDSEVNGHMEKEVRDAVV